jgi:hypothetical protein
VLPGIVWPNVQAFLDLCDVPTQTASPEREIQFLTEYGYLESAWYDKTGRWSTTDFGRDTPDVVLCGPDWILAVEAKLYARQGAEAISSQLRGQRRLLDSWSKVLGIATSRVRLVALLPGEYAKTLPGLGEPVITWEQVRDAYRGLAPSYWIDVLDIALQRYDELKSAYGSNADATMTGDEIASQWRAGTLPFSYVGRGGGQSGRAFAEDVASGTWRGRRYQVRVDPIDNGNWWAIELFVAAVTSG